MIDSGSVAFIIIAATYVFIMTPGLAFFYGGLAQRKNVVNTMMMSVFIMGLASVLWILCGYSLSFSGDNLGIIGNLKWFAFNGVSLSEAGPYSDVIPNGCFAIFQMMFAIITPALITGAVAGRMKFKAIFFFVLFWLFLVYFPLAHMVWGGGFLAKIGSVDFAGGNVVHISSGVTGLVLAIILGKRKLSKNQSVLPHNIPFVVLGASLLWFGWFGFNAGSALAADGLAIHAFITTNTSAACAMLSWMLIDTLKEGRPTLVGACTGLVVGLVAITPGAGFVPIWASFIIGALVSPICYFAVSFLKVKFGYDDALDAFGCHGIGGVWGGIATGLFAKNSINPVAQWDGLVFGETKLFVAQVISIVVTIAMAVVGTLICAGVVRLFTKLRVDTESENVGLDESEHGESAYRNIG